MFQNKKLKPNNLKQSLNSYAKYSSLGFQMVFIILAGTFGGFKLDGYTGFKFPIFTIVLSISSVALAIYFAVKDFIKPNDKSKN
ncbi:MAG: AtpZ/AtpI family protein [Bacteroidota bacterium]